MLTTADGTQSYQRSSGVTLVQKWGQAPPNVVIHVCGNPVIWHAFGLPSL